MNTATPDAAPPVGIGYPVLNAVGPKVFWTTRSDITPLRYPGGKRKLGPLVADLIKRSGSVPRILGEPFAGGAAVSISLLEAGYVEEIVLNDMDPLVASFWGIVFSAESELLADMVENATVSVSEWYRMKKLVPRTMIEAAFQCLYLNRTSFSGSLHKEAGPMGGRTQAKGDLIGSRFNRTKIAARIRELGGVRDRVRDVTCGNYRDTLERHDSPDAFWYLDPPFFAKADRLYRHHFDGDAHVRLADDIGRLSGGWILSYDDHPDAYPLYAQHNGFARIELQYTAAVGEQRFQKGEILVSNIIASERDSGMWPTAQDLVIPRRSVKANRNSTSDHAGASQA
ncbi:DNA adenine methylase [Agrobacterium rubi]|nr:DNA adenine methylase [Agrobacterium rubi]NTF24688.1 DNA adenine methylase [Agrobacterium rubi]